MCDIMFDEAYFSSVFEWVMSYKSLAIAHCLNDFQKEISVLLLKLGCNTHLIIVYLQVYDVEHEDEVKREHDEG